MANDIDGLTTSSDETVSQPCYRADLTINEPDGRSEYSGNDAATMNSDSVSDGGKVKSENQSIDNNCFVPNGCACHHGVDDGVRFPASTGDENRSLPSSEPSIYSGEADGRSFGNDIIELSGVVAETAGADCRKSSPKISTRECVATESCCTGDQLLCEFANEDGRGSEADAETLSEQFASAKISNDLPEVPLDAVSDEKLHAEGEVPCGSNRSSNEYSNGIEYVMYESEKQMPDIMSLITKDLSEPYSIYTYRYFIHNWPNLCFLALHQSKCVGAIVCKLDTHKKIIKRGYIAMLAVAQDYRKRGIGSHLVIRAIRGMVADGCDEVVLETEITNRAALHLYENLGFVRDKRLFRYYLNGVDALRLKLWLK